MSIFTLRKLTHSILAFSLTLLCFLTPVMGHAQCTLSVSSSDTAICVGDTVSLSALIPPGTPLTTTFAAGNNHRGNMFDLTAINTLTITSFDAHPMGNTTIEIYYRVGTHVGYQTSSTGWTLIGSAAVVAQPMGTPTPVPVPINITIPAGQTYAFYVTSTNTTVSLNYSDGVSLGSIAYQDANLQFHEGSGLEYPFGAGSSPFTPRNWNGRIHYSLPGSATYTWSTGSSTASFMDAPVSTTTYVVNAVFNGGACNVTDSVTVQVSPVPVVNLGPDQTFCQGSPVTLDAGNAGSTYQWSNGSNGQTTVIPNGGNYCVTVTNAGGCESVDCITLTANTPPAVNLGGASQSYCEGSPLVLDAGNPGSTYVWSTGTSGQTETTNGSGTYAVTVTDNNGCSSMDSTVVTMNPNTVDLGPDTVFCGGSAILSAGSGHVSNLWSTSDTSATITVSTSGTYSVSSTDANGCTFSDTISVTFAQVPVSAFSFSANNLTVNFTDASTGATSWLWDFGDGNTSTLPNPTHTYATDGNYTVTLTVTNACGTDDMDQSLTLTGIADGLAGATLYVSPNPGNEGFRLSLEGILGNDVLITISDLRGRLVQNHQVLLNGGSWNGQMDLSTQPAGVYLIQVATESGRKTVKWIKQ